jgi:hypothetical protein
MYLAICQYPIDRLTIPIYNLPMTSYRWKWTATIKKQSLVDLQDMAAGLGFFVTAPGGLTGRPSPADMLDALAAAYRLDPAGTLDALRVLLVPPDAPDA